MSANNIIDSNFLTYVAGILVPTSEISVTAAFNAVPTASITLPPYPQLFGIGRQDRLPVHIFSKDPIDQEYTLFFEGEVTSFSYSDAIYARSITINAQGLLAFLQDINIKFLSSLDDVASANVAGASDTNLQTFTNNVIFPYSLFAFGLGEARPENLISYPAQYLQNMVDFVAGGGTQGSSFGAVNNSELAQFYADYCEKIKLANRFDELPYFDEPESEVWPAEEGQAKAFPLLASMQKEKALDQLKGLADAGVQGGSVSHLINYVVNQLEYEFSIMQSPSYIDGKAITMCLKPMFYDTVPPACNVLYRSQVLSVSTMEKVYGVPTRVRTMDINGALAKLAQGVNTPLTEYGLVDYYPSNKYSVDHVAPSNPNDQNLQPAPNYMATELLDEDGGFDSEKFTGPWVYETAAPSWMSFVGPAAIEENRDLFKKRLLARLLMHKQFEYRTLQVSAAFNPYVVPGYPGAVYDSKDPGFIFCGHIYAVNHSISKTSLHTSLEMGFVRLVEEAINAPVENPIPSFDLVVKDHNKMTEVYQATIESDALSWEEVSQRRNIAGQNDPLGSYALQKRGIIKMDEYLAFMGMGKEMGILGDGEEVPVVLTGAFVEDRRDLDMNTFPPFESESNSVSPNVTSTGSLTGIRKVLRTIAEREFSKVIYRDDTGIS